MHFNAAMMLDELFNTPGKSLQNEISAPSWSDSLVFHQSSFTSIITALTLILSVNGPLFPIYTWGQYQPCDDASNTALIESNRVAPESVVTPLFSMRTV